MDEVFRFDEGLEHSGAYRKLRGELYACSHLTFFSSEHKPHIDYYANGIIDTCSLIMLGKRLADHQKWLEVRVSPREQESLDEKLLDVRIDFERAVVIHPRLVCLPGPPSSCLSVLWRDRSGGGSNAAAVMSQRIVSREGAATVARK
ncbi:MAG: hypothetical protein GF418_07815 [Chitinivibrionales bacterium]|nr:hypothetical protein [Chitinivibrionales bacterium]MBD3395519.1 hypothetical protein [Chitinivibrionales bacterium]